MKFVAPVFVVFAASSCLIACSGSSRPAGKPASGPPPEYEAPRSFDLPNAGAPASSASAPPEEAPPTP